jgi:hypothetical protein
MFNRYPKTAGCRLDTEDDPQHGAAIDVGGPLRRVLTNDANHGSLWVRDAEGNTAKVEINSGDVRALRDGLTRMLIEAGYEREITVAVSA